MAVTLLQAVKEVDARLRKKDNIGALRLATGILQQVPDQAATWYLAGRAYWELGDRASAERAFRSAWRISPAVPTAGLAVARSALCRHDAAEAVTITDEVLAREPESYGAWLIKADALCDLAAPEPEVRAAYAACRRTARTAPQRSAADYNASLAWLRYGDWRDGWTWYDERWRTEEFVAEQAAVAPPPVGRRWRGGDLRGKHLLLWGEQGLGDVLMMLRFVPLVRVRYAPARVTVRAVAPLLPLLEANRDVLLVDDCVDEQAPLPRHDAQCPILSLPLVCEAFDPFGLPHLLLRPPARPE